MVSSETVHQLNRSVPDAFGKMQLLLLLANDRHLLSVLLAKLLKKNQIYREMWLCYASVTLQDRCHSQWNRSHAQESLIH